MNVVNNTIRFKSNISLYVGQKNGKKVAES